MSPSLPATWIPLALLLVTNNQQAFSKPMAVAMATGTSCLVVDAGDMPCIYLVQRPGECDGDGFWRRPCAGCRAVQGSVHPAVAAALGAVRSPPLDMQCLLDRLSATLENTLEFIRLSKEDGRHEGLADDVNVIIQVAHDFNVRTTWKCTRQIGIYHQIQTNLAIAAASMEKIYNAEKAYLLMVDGDLPCRIFRALRVARMLLRDALCQLTVELQQNPVVPFTALSTELPVNLLDRNEAERVHALYAMKMLRKGVRLLKWLNYMQ